MIYFSVVIGYYLSLGVVMIVRQNFQEMPPKAFMEQIMDSVCKAYCFLWERRDSLNRIIFTWPELQKYYNKNNFRTNLRKLNNEGLLSYDESEKGISIELVGWDELEEV